MRDVARRIVLEYVRLVAEMDIVLRHPLSFWRWRVVDVELRRGPRPIVYWAEERGTTRGTERLS